MRAASLANRLRRLWHGRAVQVVHHPAYRLPLPALETRLKLEPRRADFALWYLLTSGALSPRSVRRPQRISYEDLARVHTPELLDALARPEALAAVYSVDPAEVRVDELLDAVRLACGGTLQSARFCLAAAKTRATSRPGACALNLLGGFHHAGPGRAGGFCPVNDIAVAVASLRKDGFAGRIAVLDFDAHPPDGTAECLRRDAAVFIGSISGVSFGALEGVDETVLPPGTGDDAYLEALDALLARMPTAQLAFVIAGGDVLRGDALGQLGLSLDGARRRDLRVSAALGSTPSVWLPGGGYADDAWRALAGTGLALSINTRTPVPGGFDPLRSRYRFIARTLATEQLGLGAGISLDDVAEDLGLRPRRPGTLLGFYSAGGIEHALDRYGILAELTSLGYGAFRVELSADDDVGDRLRVFGSVGRAEYLLIETVLERRIIDGAPVLYVHWLTLRNPAARFTAQRPRLPGQEVPGLGLAHEAAELFARMAERLGLEGVAFRPANFHNAYAGRTVLRFVEAGRQGRFEALLRDLAGTPPAALTQALAEGRVQMNDAPYVWEAEEMVRWRASHPVDAAAVASERERVHFSLLPLAPEPAA